MSKNTGLNNLNLKFQNRGLLLQLIATNENLSRVDLSKMSGLTKMSVSNIISEFIEKKLVVETSIEVKTTVGRTPILLDISDEAPKIIGLLINRDGCTVVLCDLKLHILFSKTESFDDCNNEQLLGILYSLIDEVLCLNHQIIGIGVASIGSVNIDEGLILNPPDFYGITDIKIVELLERKYQLPVYFDHHYNAAALVEHLYGNGKQYSDFIFLGITNGIGSGIILDGQLYRNANGLTSEIGHTSIDYHGNPCSCGRKGCLETYASTKVILRKYNELTRETLSFQELCEKEDEPIIKDLLLDMTEKLALGLVNGVNLLNPQAIMLGDEGVYFPENDRYLLEELVNADKLSKDYHHINVMKPYFGCDSQLVGSACCLINHIFQGELLFDK